jgi:hypothetical protein
MTIAKGRTNFECYLDELFIVLERYLDLVPVLILEAKTFQIKETDKIIEAEKDPYINESISTYLFDWNRFEDFDEMTDIFYKSYLISLCSYCESFISKIYCELLRLNVIETIKKNKKHFIDYWIEITKYIGDKSEFDQTIFHKIFEIRNLIVHCNSSLIEPNKTYKNIDISSKRTLYVNEYVEKYPNSLKIEDEIKLIFIGNEFLKETTLMLQHELLCILLQTETKLSESGLNINL